MAALRTPVSGCEWDLAQTFESIVPYTIEEAYEVADAVATQDPHNLKEELGDLLLQVVFHARIAEERRLFDFGAVVEAITEKLIRRHPHVFGESRGLSVEEIEEVWAKIKAAEKSARDGSDGGALAGVTLALPGLTRAVKLQTKASAVGFDWNDARQVLAKIREETDEVESALLGGDRDAVIDEVGDLFFVLANLARHVGADPEASIRRANDKFERRFGYIEQGLARVGRSLVEATLEEMDALWNEAKQNEPKSVTKCSEQSPLDAGPP